MKLRTLTLVITLAIASHAQAWWQPLKAHATKKLGNYAHKALAIGVAAHVLAAGLNSQAAIGMRSSTTEQAPIQAERVDNWQTKNSSISLEHRIFQLALFSGNLPVVKRMTAANATKAIYNNFYSVHRTMYWAARYGHLHIVKWSWENGVSNNPDAFFLRETKKTAALAGDLEVVRYLHQLGASGTTQALYKAASSGDVPTFHYLLMAAYDEHNKDLPHVILEESLWRALVYDRLGIIEYLLPYLDNAFWHEVINEHLTTASIYGHLKIVKYLVAAGASDIITAIENLENVIMVADQRGTDSTRERAVLQYLLQYTKEQQR